jgi:hypothetical protein
MLYRVGHHVGHGVRSNVARCAARSPGAFRPRSGNDIDVDALGAMIAQVQAGTEDE